MMVPTRQTAEERRTSVLAAAVTEFARNGYVGTSTEAIARRAGISQPYLFRLFGTKKDLFIATHEMVGSRIVRELTAACGDLQGEEAMSAMGNAYLELMADPELLQVQMHGFAAATSDPDIAASCRRTFERLHTELDERIHLTDDDTREFFAHGMLMSVMSAIDLLSIPDSWAQSLCPDPSKWDALHRVSESIDRHRYQSDEPNEVTA